MISTWESNTTLAACTNGWSESISYTETVEPVTVPNSPSSMIPIPCKIIAKINHLEDIYICRYAIIQWIADEALVCIGPYCKANEAQSSSFIMFEFNLGRIFFVI